MVLYVALLRARAQDFHFWGYLFCVYLGCCFSWHQGELVAVMVVVVRG